MARLALAAASVGISAKEPIAMLSSSFTGEQIPDLLATIASQISQAIGNFARSLSGSVTQRSLVLAISDVIKSQSRARFHDTNLALANGV